MKRRPIEDNPWVKTWNDRLSRNLEVHSVKNPLGQWESREEALAYWKSVQAKQKRRIGMALQDLPLRSDSRVLDIGGGPGALALPFARRTAHVTVVEPAAGMCRVLQEKMAETGLSNITCLSKCWEEVDVQKDLRPPYDVVVAAFSLTMFDINDAVMKMHEVSSGVVCLYWFIGEPAWETESRWLMPLLRGKGYTPLPKCDILIPLLHHLGIAPKYRLLSYTHCEFYADLNEAVDSYARYYGISGKRPLDLLRRYLDGRLEPENGELVHYLPAACLKLWWEKGLSPTGLA